MVISQMRFVIIADGHFNPLGLARSLGRKGIHPDVVVVGDANALISKSKYPRSIVGVETANNAVDYVLKHFAAAGSKSFLMTGADKSIAEIDRRYDELEPYFITYNCGEQGAINRLMSKSLQNELAAKVGFYVPDFEVVEVGQLPSRVKFPIITKAIDSKIPGWKQLVHICNNEQELLEAYKVIDCPKILLQHYVPKVNETGFNGISILHGKEVYIPLQLSYYSIEPDTFGNHIYLFKPVDTELVDKVKRLIAATGYEGAFSVDLLIGEDGNTYFLEINFRNSGWAFPYTCAGVNLPYIWADSMLSGRLETDNVQIKTTPFSCIVDLWEISAQMKRGIGRGLKTIWHTLTADSHIFYDRHDNGPFWHIVKCWLKTHFHIPL